jgi:4-hydroxy-L-threonine phosphate dehydrogenase PdxA
MKRPIIAPMMGDAAGVRPEVIMKSIAHPGLNGLCRSIVIDDSGRLEEAGRMSAATLRSQSASR